MPIESKTKEAIANLLISTVKGKLDSYKPETTHAPFHHRLLGRDRCVMFSFIQSMNTTFGTSLFEQIAVILAKGARLQAERQHKVYGQIDIRTEKLVRDINHKLRAGEIKADKKTFVEKIRKAIKLGKAKKDPDSVVDVFIKIGDQENFFDITSVKPNMKEFASLQLKLLRWTALRLSTDKKVKIVTRLAIPYNPYHPAPYERWTLKGLYDLKADEVLVGEDFWSFVGGGKIYEDLLNIFEDAGKTLQPILDRYFSKLK